MYRFLFLLIFPAFAFSQVEFNQLEYRDYDLVYIKNDSVPFTGKCSGICRLFNDTYKFGRVNYLFRFNYLTELSVRGKYKNGKAEGKWIYKTIDGEIIAIQRFKAGKLNGRIKLYYYLNGKIKSKFKMKMGKLNGMEYVYDKDGKIIYKAKYRQNELVKEFINLLKYEDIEIN